MMIALEIFGAVATALTIFSAGVAVGRFIEHSKNFPKCRYIKC